MTALRIVSTTLVGVGRVGEAVHALQSASRLVDDFLVVDTAPLSVPVVRFSSDAHVSRFPWTGRFDDARNECLRLAAEAVADWSIMIDSDERIACPDPAAVRAFLTALDPRVQIVCAFASDGTYQRERFFRGTIPQRWKFRTHESIDAGPGEQALIPAELISWSELPKTGAQVVEKSKRDVSLIREDLAEHPNETRLWFYLGNSLSHIGPEHYEEAIAAYRKVADVGTGEGCAWACFCAARLYFEQAKRAGTRMEAEPDEEKKAPHRADMWRLAYKALDCCSAGVHREPRVAELHWLAGAINHAIDNHELGQAWARQAAVHGVNSPSYPTRRGFMVPHALRDGPAVLEAMCVASMSGGRLPVPGGFAATPSTTEPSTCYACGHPFAQHANGPCDKCLCRGYGRVVDVAVPRDKAIRPRVEYVRGPVHITVTSTALRAEQWAGRCIRSVREQGFAAWDMHYVACDDATALAAEHARHEDKRIHIVVPEGAPPLLANLLPIWRALPPEEVIVWLDGDDWLATDRALARVADAHSRGMLATYGSFIYDNGCMGFAGQCGEDPRTEPWRATHLKSFRAGLVQRVREADWRWNDGKYLDLAIDQAVMLPVLEMAGRERAEYVPEILAVYNVGHAFESNGSEAEKEREAVAVGLIRGRRRYERIGVL